jgi:cellulose synthase operon protein C
MTKPLVFILLLLATGVAVADTPSIGDANRLFLTGKYAEAEEAFASQANKQPVEAAVGSARCQQATGKPDKAEAGLKAAATKNPRSAALQAELALLALERGDYGAAAAKADAAILIDNNCAPARWVQAELLRLAGKLTEAEASYKWFVDYYNATDEIRDVETLHYIGKAAAQYARWNGLSDQFKFLVNDLYPEILEVEKNYWPAHLEAGLLFLEKYNEADASHELKKAEAINASAAEVHAALAALALQNYELPEAQRRIDRALEINPHLLVARQLQAAVHLANFDPSKAIETLAAAIKFNPVSEETLGFLVAAQIGKVGWSDKRKPAEATKLIAEVTARNPRAGGFYEAIGDGLDLLRRYPIAAEFYAKAAELMPQLATARGKLGLVQMRLGDEATAADVLKKAFDSDPFNVRISNTLKVLEVLDTYTTIETDHFILRFDRGEDEIVAKYAARYLEENVYPALCKRLGYEPQGKSLFEIFSRSKNTSGHGWFSARMVGLPFIGTVGACAGRMVAITSPNDGKEFNWARVLKHEFVHVVNLQQTNFNIPHWYTEALAVYNEDTPRPTEWSFLLRERADAKKLFNLDTINTGFIRPKSSGDWTLAYCQAEIYAEYMVARFGEKSLGKMLAAYADHLTTPEAIQRSFGVSVEDFENGYSDFLAKIVAGLPKSPAEKKEELKSLEEAYGKDPDDLRVAAELALAYFQRQDTIKARKLVDAVLKKDAKNQLATYVLAQLKLRAGETDTVMELLEAALDRKNPQINLLSLLAGLKFKAEKFDEAESLYDLGAKRFPADVKWLKTLAQLHLKSGDNQKLYAAIEQLAKLDFDDAPTRKKLAELAAERKDHAAAERWSREVLEIDVQDANIHHLLAESLVAQQKPKAAIEEYEFAVQIAPEQNDWRFALAKAYVDAKQPDKARKAIENLLKREPTYSGAKELLDSLTTINHRDTEAQSGK